MATKSIFTYICGSSGPMDNYNPSLITRQKHAPKLLYLINEKPQSVSELSYKLRTSKEKVKKLINDLLRINAIREEDGKYKVNFCILTRDDMLKVRKVLLPVSKEIANKIMKYSAKLSELAEKISCTSHVNPNKTLFIVIGCIALDWKGLDELHKKGLLIRDKLQPGNRKYLLFGREKIDEKTSKRLFEKMYIGSHSIELDNYLFVTFGDWSGIRYAFPDFAYALSSLSSERKEITLATPKWFLNEIFEVRWKLAQKLMTDSANLLFQLIKPNNRIEKASTLEKDRWIKFLLQILKKLRYITLQKEKIKLNYPIFTPEDQKTIDKICETVLSPAVNFIKRKHREIWQLLSEISPIKNEINRKEIFCELWHWIFGYINRELCKRGLLYDPPKRKGEARYLATIIKH